MQTQGVDFDAVILAGGAATRLGGIDKAGLEVGGVSLLDRVLLASASARHTVVVGSPRPAARTVEWTIEQPPGGGPLAGLAAGMTALSTAERWPAEPGPADRGPGERGPGERRLAERGPVLVLATDLPSLRAADVDRLLAALAAAEPRTGAAVFVDGTGQRQPLAALYRRAELARAITDQQPVAGRSMRSLLAQLIVIEVPDEGAAADVDTPAQLTAAQLTAAQSAAATGLGRNRA